MMMVRDHLVTITRAGQSANTHRKPRITITARASGAAGWRGGGTCGVVATPSSSLSESKRQLSALSRNLTSVASLSESGKERERELAQGCGITFPRIYHPVVFTLRGSRASTAFPGRWFLTPRRVTSRMFLFDSHSRDFENEISPPLLPSLLPRHDGIVSRSYVIRDRDFASCFVLLAKSY